MEIGTKVFFDGGETHKKDGWRPDWNGILTSHEHPNENVVMVKPDNKEFSIPMFIYELKIV